MLRVCEFRLNSVMCSLWECLSLCAGFSLGLVNLGAGSNIQGMHDLKLDERLL